jgi:hypothetical protein
MSKSKYRPLRDWACGSYDSETGRPASGTTRSSPHTAAGDRQVPTHGLDQKMGEASSSQAGEAKHQRSCISKREDGYRR